MVLAFTRRSALRSKMALYFIKSRFIVPVFPCRWGTPLLFQKFAQPFLRGQFPHQLTVRWDSISLQIVLTELLLLHRILRGDICRIPQRSAQTVPNLLLWWFHFHIPWNILCHRHAVHLLYGLLVCGSFRWFRYLCADLLYAWAVCLPICPYASLTSLSATSC